MAQKKSHFGIGMAVGAVAGAVAGLFLAPKAGKELREDAMKMYKKLHTEDPKVLAKKVFGDISEESQRLVKKAYEDLSVELAGLKKRYSTIDTAKYKEAVGKVVTTIKKEGTMPEDAMKKLKTFLEDDAKKLVSSPGAKKVVKKLTAAKKSLMKMKPKSTTKKTA